MILPQDKTKVEEIAEILDQMEDLFSDLRWEYLHMARRVDEAIERISGYYSRVNRKPLKALLFAERFSYALDIVISCSNNHYYT